MIIFVLTFAIMLDIILADLKATKDKKYGFGVEVKSFDFGIREYFGL